MSYEIYRTFYAKELRYLDLKIKHLEVLTKTIEMWGNYLTFNFRKSLLLIKDIRLKLWLIDYFRFRCWNTQRRTWTRCVSPSNAATPFPSSTTKSAPSLESSATPNSPTTTSSSASYRESTTPGPTRKTCKLIAGDFFWLFLQMLKLLLLTWGNSETH